jgi:DNA-binding GntR family transcriptional regulator
VVTTITVNDAEGIYEARAVLEGLAGRLFAERATPEGVAALNRALAALEDASRSADPKALLRSKDEFYEVLLQGCGNDVIYSLLKSLQDRITFLRAMSISKPDRLPHTLAEMRRIVAAIEERDPEAAWKACVEHVQRAASVALQALREQRMEESPHAATRGSVESE